MEAFAHLLGLDDVSGPFYAFWSGFGSDISEFALVGALVSFYWRHTCHAKRCLRVARHPVDGTSFVVCRKHHPDPTPDHAEILRQHRNMKIASRFGK